MFLNQWNKIWRSNTITFKSINIKTQMFKTIAKWHLAPSKVHYKNPNQQSTCCKRCNEQISYLHTWWSCKYIQSFWHLVQSQIYTITSYSTLLKPELMLKLWNNIDIPLLRYKLTALLCTAAQSSQQTGKIRLQPY